MKLYIAEKPSLGRAIAAALPQPHKKSDGYIATGSGDVVSWCLGHILEQAEPEAYDPKFKKWRFEHLPILPKDWQLKPKKKTRSQLTVLRKLIKKADVLVHAGDPDREGQLLVDEVLHYLKVPSYKLDKTQRLLISDLNVPAVKKALATLKDNKTFRPLSVSALARSRADWLYGINLTRAYTIQGQRSGFKGVLSVGRVQTPVLGLVVRRDEEIANFTPKDYYEVQAYIKTEQEETFTAKWVPSEACEPHMDEEGRIINKALAENVASRISDKPALVKDLSQQQKKQNAPLPYNLSALQIDAANRYALNAKRVLDVCQSLYEKHNLVTYPRSDCRYLPSEHFKQAPRIVSLLSNTSNSAFEETSSFAKNADVALKSKAWNSSKVGAHHAIIPTEKSVDRVQLSQDETKVYQLIVRQYLAQFYPAYLYLQTKVTLNIEGGKFVADARQEQQLGWKQLFKSSDKSERTSKTLPPLTKGQVTHCVQGEMMAKITQPPKHFTDATLLSSMTGIAKYVTCSDIKKVLKETDGLGTEATRAGIIELLFKRKFLIKKGKNIHATEIGKTLINTLPKSTTLPDMTAHWESVLNAISDSQASYASFMSPLEGTVQNLVREASQKTVHF